MDFKTSPPEDPLQKELRGLEAARLAYLHGASPLTPEQVRQLDAQIAALHAQIAQTSKVD